jgi:hypothetical protein
VDEQVGTAAGPRAPAARRFARLFAGLVTAWLLGTAGLNWLVNPWALYAPRLLEPRVADDRYRKCGLLRRFQPPPEQLILGSSRTMRFEPRLLEERTGLRTFNLGIPGAQPVDYLTLYRFATEEVRAPVRSVTLGVETPAFFGHERNYPALAANTELARFLPKQAGVPANTTRLAMLLNPAQTSDAWASLLHLLGLRRRSDPPWRRLEADGFQSRSNHDEERERRRFNLAREVRAQLKSDYLNRRDVDTAAFRDFDRLLVLLERRGVRTVVFMTPSLEASREYWRRHGLIEAEQSVAARIRSMAVAHGARFVDLSTVESFHGDPAEFYDAIHPTVVNTRRMIDALFPVREAREE